MAELSVDEAQRLARLFLTGQAGDTEVLRLQNALGEDQGVALELLAQMQSALDDSAPGGLNAEQDRSVNTRIEALLTPRIKKRGPFSFIMKLFRSKPKVAEEEAPAKSRRRRRGAEPEAAPPPPEPAPLPEPMIGGPADSLGETLPGEGMEEMAPIAAPSPIVPAPDAALGAGSPSPAPAIPGEPAARNKFVMPVLIGLGVVAIIGLIGLGIRAWIHRAKPAPRPAPTVAVTVSPRPTAIPKPSGVHRGVAVGPGSNEALPSEIPATTPVSAGSWPTQVNHE